MCWKLIVNPVAGSGYALKVAEQVKQTLTERGYACELLYTKAPGHATELAHSCAADDRCRAVLAIGGDGTAFEVASGLAGTGIPMGIIPAGTGNDFIKTVRIPKEPMAALEFVLTHTPRAVDIGSINQQHFLNVCGTGFDVTVLEQMEKLSSSMRGITPYLIALVKAITVFKPIHVRYTIEGQAVERDVLICAVANGRFIGGGIPICPKAEVDDHLLDVVIVDAVPRWKVPFYLPGLLMGKVLDFKISSHVRCQQISIESKDMSLQIDGEIFHMDHADFAVQPSVLQLYW